MPDDLSRARIARAAEISNAVFDPEATRELLVALSSDPSTNDPLVMVMTIARCAWESGLREGWERGKAYALTGELQDE